MVDVLKQPDLNLDILNKVNADLERVDANAIEFRPDVPTVEKTNMTPTELKDRINSNRLPGFGLNLDFLKGLTADHITVIESFWIGTLTFGAVEEITEEVAKKIFQLGQEKPKLEIAFSNVKTISDSARKNLIGYKWMICSLSALILTEDQINYWKEHRDGLANLAFNPDMAKRLRG